jgi:hypothetical protein
MPEMVGLRRKVYRDQILYKIGFGLKIIEFSPHMIEGIAPKPRTDEFFDEKTFASTLIRFSQKAYQLPSLQYPLLCSAAELESAHHR